MSDFKDVIETYKDMKEKDFKKKSEIFNEMANLRKKDTKLPANLWIDEGQLFILGKHAERIKFQGNHADRIRKDLLFPIDLNGVIHFDNNEKDCELNTSERDEIKNFVLNNRDILKVILDKKFSTEEMKPYFITGGDAVGEEEKRKLRKVVNTLLRNKGYESLTERYEISKITKPTFIRQRIDLDNDSEDLIYFKALNKKQTGLPMTIWIDEAYTYKSTNHEMRIKMNADYQYALRDRNDLFEVDMEGNIYSHSKENEDRYRIKDKDFQALKNFLHNNKYALQKIADDEIASDEIIPYMIKGGELADEEEIKKLKEITDSLSWDDSEN